MGWLQLAYVHVARVGRCRDPVKLWGGYNDADSEEALARDVETPLLWGGYSMATRAEAGPIDVETPLWGGYNFQRVWAQTNGDVETLVVGWLQRLPRRALRFSADPQQACLAASGMLT